jgi:hypothetical protein
LVGGTSVARATSAPDKGEKGFLDMQRTPAKFMAVCATTLLIGCSDDDNDEAPSLAQRTQVATLRGNPGWENLSGESRVDWTPGGSQFLASIRLDGDEPGALRPWHVHFGTCSTGGNIVGPSTDYPALAIDEDGSASSSARIDFELSASAPYHVNVHLSPARMATLIACGDLAQQGTGGVGGTAGAGGVGGVAGTSGSGGSGTAGAGGSGTAGAGGSGTAGAGGSGTTGAGGSGTAGAAGSGPAGAGGAY